VILTLADAATGGAVAVVFVFWFIMAERCSGASSRRRDERLRPAAELTVATSVVDGNAAPPPRPTRSAERRVLRDAALEALIELRGGERRRVTELLESAGLVEDTAGELHSRSTTRRRLAADALAQMESLAARPALEERLADRDAEVRLIAARGLAALAPEECGDAVVEVAERDADARADRAANVLLALGVSNPAALARALAPGRPPAIRRLAASVLGELRAAQHAPLLRAALGDEDDEIVARAARGLGAIGDADSSGELADVALDPERPPFVRAAATKAIGAIGDAGVTRSLEWQLRSRFWALQEEAARALLLVGPTGREALERACSDRAGVRVHAAGALQA